jgi:hypothetical protein
MKPKSRLVAGIFSLAMFLPLASQAGDEAPAGDKPSISATQTVKLTTIVENINLESRRITLRGPEGNSRTIIASEEAKNLDQIDIGDKVNVEYVQHMSIEVFANDGMEPGAGTMSATARNTEDEAPGGMMMETTVLTATVEDINIEANTFKLKWPDGEIEQYEAQDPENLKKAAVGDLVVITHTEALAMYLNEVPAE